MVYSCPHKIYMKNVAIYYSSLIQVLCIIRVYTIDGWDITFEPDSTVFYCYWLYWQVYKFVYKVTWGTIQETICQPLCIGYSVIKVTHHFLLFTRWSQYNIIMRVRILNGWSIKVIQFVQHCLKNIKG